MEDGRLSVLGTGQDRPDGGAPFAKARDRRANIKHVRCLMADKDQTSRIRDGKKEQLCHIEEKQWLVVFDKRCFVPGLSLLYSWLFFFFLLVLMNSLESCRLELLLDGLRINQAWPDP